jgi:histidyl-tRNA synthetase
VRTLGLQDLKVLINTLGDSDSRAAYQKALKAHFAQPIEHFCADCQRRYEQNPLRILDCKVDQDDPALVSAPKLRDYLNDSSKAYFEQVLSYLRDSDVEVEIADKLVRGLDYYTHTVFEVISVNASMGSQSTVFGGGRYDNLVSDLGGPALSGIGFGMGIERLLVALEAEGVNLTQAMDSDVFILTLDSSAAAFAFQLTNELRMNGFVTHYDVYQKSFKSQFKAADRKQAKVVILLGENELKNQQVVMKLVTTQEQVTVDIANIQHQLSHWLDPEHDAHCDHEHQGDSHV